MKIKIITIMILLLISGNSIYSQVRELSSYSFYKQGDIEFSFSASVGKDFGTSSVIVWDSFTSHSFKRESDFNQLHVFLNSSAGYYIVNGLSIEPEVKITLTGNIPYVILIGGLSYTIYLPLKDLAPFVKIGYGWAIEQKDFSVITGTFGIKFRYTSTMAVKLEINYLGMDTEYSYSNDYSGYPTSFKTEISHKLLLLSAGIFILI